MRLAGIEKGGYYPYPPHRGRKLRLPGSSRFLQAHVGDYSILAQVKARSPAYK